MDALSVSPRCQGKGDGSKLIKAVCDRTRKLGHHGIALLADVDALRLHRAKSIGPDERWKVPRASNTVLSSQSDITSPDGASTEPIIQNWKERDY